MTETVVVAPGIEIPRVLTETFDADDAAVGNLSPGEVMPMTVSLAYQLDSGRYEVERVEFGRTNREREVSTLLLQSVRMQEIVRRLIKRARLPAFEAVRALDLAAERAYRKLYFPEEGRLPRAPYRSLDVDTEDLLVTVALVYRATEISNDNAAAAVGTRLLMGTRTATNWVKRARDRGYMSAVRPPGDVDERAGRVVAAMQAKLDEEA